MVTINPRSINVCHPRSSLLCSVILVALLPASCGKKPPNSDCFTIPDSDYAGLAFTTLATSSSLYYNDFGSCDLKEILSGESSDPLISWQDNQLWHFNRTNVSLNFRVLDPRVTTAKGTTQIATPGSVSGDPHGILKLSKDRVLLGNYVAGNLVVMRSKSIAREDAFTKAVEIDQEITAKWDLGGQENAQLRPELFFQTQKSGAKIIYVVHQGLDKNYAFDGSQQIFVLSDDGTTVTVQDQNETKTGIQGIPLKIGSPSLVIPFGDNSVIIGGTCTLAYSDGCHGGFEWLDLSTNKSELLVDLDLEPFKGNGGLIMGRSKQEALALMVQDLGDGNLETVVASIDVTANPSKRITPLFTFPSGSSGCCALYFDETSKTLFVGDTNADKTGVLHLMSIDGTPKTDLSLSTPPYTGVLIPKS